MSGPQKENQSRPAGSAPLGSLVIPVLVVLMLLASGIGFKIHIEPPSLRDPTPLRKEFKYFPTDFLGYQWRWKILDKKTEEVTGADAYLNLQGFRKSDGSFASLYTSYVGKGTTMVQHEPQVCYRALAFGLPFGVKKAEIKDIQVVIDDEGTIGPLPVNIYLFEKDVEHQMVINSYCINGYYTSNRSTVRTEADKPGGFYAQTRVSLALSNIDWAEANPETGSPTRSRRFLQAVEILRYVTPLIRDEYLPPAPQSSEE